MGTRSCRTLVGCRGLDATQRAYVIWKQWLMDYTPPALDPAIRQAVEDYVARRSKELENVELYND